MDGCGLGLSTDIKTGKGTAYGRMKAADEKADNRIEAREIFETRPVPAALARMAVPTIVSQLITLIYNIADTFFVSLTKEPVMIAAVTLCAPLLLIIMSIACIFGMGGSSVIARLLGEEKREESGTTMNFCVYAMAIAGIMTLVLGLVFYGPWQ